MAIEIGEHETRRTREDIYLSLSSPLRILPTAMIIGSPKAGTTSLFQYLTKHPAVLFSRPKEVYFFDKDFHKGLLWYKRYFPTVYRKYVTRNTAKHDPIVIEATTTYFEHPRVPQRIHDTLPNTKLMLLLRNPVDRAYSRYYHQVDRDREPLSFEEAIAAEPERLAGESERMETDEEYYSWQYRTYSYLDGGIYATKLERWLKCFSREQLLVLSSEAFFSQTAACLQQVATFLDIPQWRPNIEQIYNKTKSKDPLDQATRQQLIAYFKPHNEKLYNLLGERFDWDK